MKRDVKKKSLESFAMALSFLSASLIRGSCKLHALDVFKKDFLGFFISLANSF